VATANDSLAQSPFDQLADGNALASGHLVQGAMQPGGDANGHGDGAILAIHHGNHGAPLWCTRSTDGRGKIPHTEQLRRAS
jgi:hypothetical protein